jgi:VIT1/CCC1 family predicted Fe2+/Mn2+ transporter
MSSEAMIPDWIRNQAMSDAGSRIGAARGAAQASGGNDPSLSAYGGLNALLSGQGETARAANAGALGWTQHLADQKWQEDQMRLRYKLEEEAARKASQNQWLSTLGSTAGKIGAAYFTGGASTAAGL